MTTFTIIITLVLTFLAGYAAGMWYNSKLLINLLKEQEVPLFNPNNNNR